METDPRRLEVLRQVLDAFNRHDLDAIMAHLAEDCVLESPRGPDPWGRRFEGKDDVRRGLAARFEGIPDVHYGDDDHFVSGDRGVSEWTLSGTTVDGERVEVRGCDLWTFGEDGRVVRKDSFWKIRDPAGLHRTIPALPVRDVGEAVAYYRERFGFDPLHETGDFAVLARDDAVLHLWGATDDEWRSRADLERRPISSGAESFLAGTASCRIEVADVDALFAELQAAGVLHDVSRDGVSATDFGTREFATLDTDGNLLTFFRWE